MPPISVVPFRASIDHATSKVGWDEHTDSFASRRDIAFVGGGTFANRASVRWLLRETIPALQLPDSEGGCSALRTAKIVMAGSHAWADEAKYACADAKHQRNARLASLLCEMEPSTDRNYSARGALAVGPLPEVGGLLRDARLFVISGVFRIVS